VEVPGVTDVAELVPELCDDLEPELSDELVLEL
jgi:hypothetical protein